jgi:hypothetical protein
VLLLRLLYLTLWGNYSGLVADIDIESEKYRWMGSARFDFYVCIHIFFRSLQSLETDALRRNKFCSSYFRFWFA